MSQPEPDIFDEIDREADSLFVAQGVCTDRALADVDRAAAYVREFRPLAAQRLAQRLRATGDSLVTAP